VRSGSLGSLSHLAQTTLPKLTAQRDEEDLKTVEAGGGLGSFLFDGYSAKDEFAGIILRTCTSNFDIVERCVAVKIFQRGLTGKQWFKVVDDERRKLTNLKLVFTIADGHPSNGIVGELMQATVDGLFHSFCFSHTLVKVGSNFQAPDADRFVKLWIAVFKNSLVARGVFQRVTGEAWKRKHKVRWWTTMGVYEQLLRFWSVLPKLFAELETANASIESLTKLKQVWNTSQSYASALVIQLMAAYDGGLQFFKATTFFEGTGFLAPFVYAYLKMLRGVVEKVDRSNQPVSTLPNVFSLIQQAPGHVNRNVVWVDAKAVLQPGFAYFRRHLIDMTEDSKVRQFKKACELFAFAQLFHPIYGKKLMEEPGFSLEGILRRETTRGVLEVLGPNILDDLKKDFPLLVSAFERNVAVDVKYTPATVVKWWKEIGGNVGAWAAAARLFTLLQPSEASCERLFSILRHSVDDSQERMLEDQVELRVRVRFSKKTDEE
jgi:hypothetical protein